MSALSAKDVLIGQFYDVRIRGEIVSVRIETRIEAGIWEASIDGDRIITLVLPDLLRLSADAAAPFPGADLPESGAAVDIVRDAKQRAAGDFE
jgi:hypothetical protein